MTADAAVFHLHPDEGAPEPEPQAPELWPAPSDPLAVARVLLEEQTADGQTLVRRWRGGWMRYQGVHWAEDEATAIRKWVYTRLEKVEYEKYNPVTEQYEPTPWKPNKNSVSNVLDAMEALTHLRETVEAPVWLHNGTSAADYIACANGLVNITTRNLRDATPNYFGLVSCPFDYDAAAPAPAEWLAFLRKLWPMVDDEKNPGRKRDADEIVALQQWFGYVLSGRTDLQKMLLLVGPRRSGKGTIARVLTKLVGALHVAAPTLASLGTNFGLQPLVGRSLAIVGDARLEGGPGQSQIVERLLSISGEDTITVDRKNREAWSGRIPARFMILSNELPKFSDTAGAIASRFVILTMQTSFLGKEDTKLGEKLDREMPGILRWALDGLSHLNREGRMSEPAASAESVEALAELVSPMAAFLKDVCDEDPEYSVPVQTLYAEYAEWCEENGRGVSSVQKLSSDIRTVLPSLSVHRPKENGKALPRQYKGLRVKSEWIHRVKEQRRSRF